MAPVPKRKLADPDYLEDDYSGFSEINGTHPFKEKVAGGFVDYAVRKRKNARVVFFNFDLAKEMGLIPKNHPETLNRALTQKLIDTFSLQIINEYDLINHVKIPKNEIKPNMYMATRYLQLQHPDRMGLTSGDGRSIWNGYFKHNGTTWDVSSCGTGATCLSPATAINKKFFRTGDPLVAYGCGYTDIEDGIANAIFSEVLHRNGLKTERTLLVLGYPRGLSINVRAAKNLLRPSHFFNHLRQENYTRLRGAVDSFITRQVNNKTFSAKECLGKNRYKYLLDQTATTFAEICAQFESEYIFCWLDWDGDNILADGGIIDYGSIRQFGLFHHEYRYDDVERWSTTITEQKKKARQIVQTFAQLCDYLETGKKKPLRKFARANILKKFDQRFTNKRRELLLKRVGFLDQDVKNLLESAPTLVKNFEKIFSYFERATSTSGPVALEDGITCNAIYSMRDILRELPKSYLGSFEAVSHNDFIRMMISSYATKKDHKKSKKRTRQSQQFQKLYMTMISEAARLANKKPIDVLSIVADRSGTINRFARITGDAIIRIGASLLRHMPELNAEDFHSLVREFVEQQVLQPKARQGATPPTPNLPKTSQKIIGSMLRIVKTHREGL
jgi:hypothetical protein